MRLENSFEVPASVEQSWRLLNDVPSVVPCLPGAELVQVVGENAWKAKLHVKLGPIALQFLADVVREEHDESAGRVLLGAKARESKGRGSAEATIESTLTAADGGTRVDLVTELALRGAVAQYGRGVVGDVASRMTADFADCLRRKLAEPESPAASPAAPASPEPVPGFRIALAALWHALLRRGGKEKVVT
jgi:carbon monoxide dehydrogenase subunit G